MEVANDEKKINSRNQELKHLRSVRIVAIKMLVCLSNLYDYAKVNSGSLKSTVETVEGAVATVVGPVYEKFKVVPDHLLEFLDEKVDLATVKFEEHAPSNSIAKQVARQVHLMIKVASEKAKDTVHLAQVGGPSAAARYIARETMNLALTLTVKVWTKLDRISPFHIVAEIVVSTATHWSEKYNKVVITLNGKGYPAVGYLPLVPIDEIARIFKQAAVDGEPPAKMHVK